MRGLRRIQRPKPPRERPGLDDPAHLATVRALPCLIRGKKATMQRWGGVHPRKALLTVEVIHLCDGRSDAHHVVRKSQRGADLGNTLPLCRSAHALLHNLGQPAFEQMFDLDLTAEARRLAPKLTPEGA